jgi:hypothetical protein
MRYDLDIFQYGVYSFIHGVEPENCGGQRYSSGLVVGRSSLSLTWTMAASLDTLIAHSPCARHIEVNPCLVFRVRP